MVNPYEPLAPPETSLERDVRKAVAIIGPVLDLLVDIGHTLRRSSGAELELAGVKFKPEYDSIHDSSHGITAQSHLSQGRLELTGIRTKPADGLFLSAKHDWYVSDTPRGAKSVNEDTFILAALILIPVANAWKDAMLPEEQVAFLSATRQMEVHAAKERSLGRTLGRMIVPHPRKA